MPIHSHLYYIPGLGCYGLIAWAPFFRENQATKKAIKSEADRSSAAAFMALLVTHFLFFILHQRLRSTFSYRQNS